MIDPPRESRVTAPRDCDHCGTAMPLGWWAYTYQGLALCGISCTEPYVAWNELIVGFDVDSMHALGQLARDCDIDAEELGRAAEHQRARGCPEQARRLRVRAHQARQRATNAAAIWRQLFHNGIVPRSPRARLDELAHRHPLAPQKAICA